MFCRRCQSSDGTLLQVLFEIWERFVGGSPLSTRSRLLFPRNADAA